MNGRGSSSRLAGAVVAVALVVGAAAGALAPPAGASLEPPSLQASRRQGPAIGEPIPNVIQGSAAIPAGRLNTLVASRYISPTSKVFVTVDTASEPNGPDLALPGLEVRAVGPGVFSVAPLDHSTAPFNGIPFRWVVFNTTALGNSAIGTATIPAGTHNVAVNLSAAGVSSTVALTVATSAGPIPGVKENNHGSGFFTVTTLDNSNAPAGGITFNYLVDNGTFPAGSGTIAAGNTNQAVNRTDVLSNNATIILTDDITSSSVDLSLPGIKVNNQGAGFFTITTAKLTAAPFSGVPFNYVVIPPPAAWEDYGPTAWSANTWTVAVDPTNSNVSYVGSQWGGVWKTTNAGDTYFPLWPVATQLVGITRLAVFPDDHNHVLALARDGFVWATFDGGTNWSKFKDAVPGIGDTYFDGGQVAVQSGAEFVCSKGGLYGLTILSSTWGPFGPAGTHQCTDIVIGSDGSYYTAFRDIGAWMLPSGSSTWIQVKKVPTELFGHPIRIAVGSARIVLNYDCTIFENSLSNLAGPNPDATWTNMGQRCATTQNGYSMSVAISPTKDDHFIVTGNEGNVTFDNGAQWSGHLDVGQDDHQTVFATDLVAFMATDLGPRNSFDGGATWKQGATAGFYSDGPPIKEYYDLTVSLPDAFGRVFVSGNSQDSGAIAMVGRNGGFNCCAGEAGLETVAPLPSFNSAFTLTSGFRVFNTDVGGFDSGGLAGELQVCDVAVPGPDYLSSGKEEGIFPVPTCGTLFDFTTLGLAPDADLIRALAAPNNAQTRVVAGLKTGSVHRFVLNNGGWSRLQLVGNQIFNNQFNGVSAMRFVSDSTLLVGYDNGSIIKVDNAFISPTVSVINIPGRPIAPIRGFANAYGDLSDIYVAYDKQVFREDANGVWTNVTGSSSLLTSNLATGVNIVGIVRDPSKPSVYVATGQRGFWAAGAPSASQVFRATVPASGTWSAFSTGLPVGIPLTGIGIAPDRALYVSSDGRGIWWRRDIAAVTNTPPNSGVNSPDHGGSAAGAKQAFVTTCSDPNGWKNISTIDFQLKNNSKTVLWVQFDQNHNLIRFYDPATKTWTTGAPGSDAVLAGHFAKLYLHSTTVAGFGPVDPTVRVSWKLAFTAAAAGHYSQYLRITDDAGKTTGFDNVGSWSVTA